MLTESDDQRERRAEERAVWCLGLGTDGGERRAEERVVWCLGLGTDGETSYFTKSSAGVFWSIL